MNKKIYLLPLVITLTACSADIDDLVVYTQQVRTNTQVNIEPYPKFEPLASVQYSAGDRRSPFRRSENRQPTAQVVQTPNCQQPNLQRRKQPLESYGLDALQMSGVFTTNGKRFALIKANDGSLHRVSVGDYVGLFHGRVVQITKSEVVIKEMLPDGTGCWKSKTANLSMSTVTGEDNNV
ncbi:pilus assembly protein PilP [Glaciecola sp. 1036]|uniref:pilus assembly protein PilP n=1 Tax=Alteromonadaceae TaxID=72275 RepID=UPI003D02FE20